MKILMIEDNISVCTMTEMFFFKEGFEAEFVHDGVEGYQRFTEEDWDLVILDIMLPSMDGVTICRKIRETSSVPIIMLTAKDTESDQVIGFEMGADDYVTKPFSPRQLVARVEAVLRRAGNHTPHVLSFQNGELVIELDSHGVKKDGNPVSLTPNEYKIISTLASYPDKVFTRDELIAIVIGDDFDGFDRVIDTHIKNIRQKIETESRNPRYILTVHGFGYKFGGS